MADQHEEDDVDRTYYVYVHRCKTSGTPFYVGKGKGKRAKSEDRLSCWHETVAKLPGGYDVEIVKKHLTEGEAYDLEGELIAKYGKLSNGTGSLTNVTDGGHLDFGEAPIIGIAIEVPGLAEHYSKIRFRPISSSEKRELANAILREMERVRPKLIAHIGGEDEQYTYAEYTINNALYLLETDARHALNRKIPREEFCRTVYSCCEDLEFREQDIAEDRPKVVKIAKGLHSFLSAIVTRILVPPD